MNKGPGVRSSISNCDGNQHHELFVTKHSKIAPAADNKEKRDINCRCYIITKTGQQFYQILQNYANSATDCEKLWGKKGQNNDY